MCIWFLGDNYAVVDSDVASVDIIYSVLVMDVGSYVFGCLLKREDTNVEYADSVFNGEHLGENLQNCSYGDLPARAL